MVSWAGWLREARASTLNEVPELGRAPDGSQRSYPTSEIRACNRARAYMRGNGREELPWGPGQWRRRGSYPTRSGQLEEIPQGPRSGHGRPPRWSQGGQDLRSHLLSPGRSRAVSWEERHHAQGQPWAGEHPSESKRYKAGGAWRSIAH